MSQNQTYSAATLVAALNSGDLKRPLTHTRTLQVIAALEGAPDWFALRHRSDIDLLKARAKLLRAELNSVQGALSEEDAAAIIGRVLAVKADTAAGGLLSLLKCIGHRSPKVRWETRSGQVVRTNPLEAEISLVAGEPGSGKSFAVSRILQACLDANVPVTTIEPRFYQSYDWCPCTHLLVNNLPPLTALQAGKTIFGPIIVAAKRNRVPSVVVFDECSRFMQPETLGLTMEFLAEAVGLGIHPILVTQSLYDLEPIKPLFETYSKWRANVYQFKSRYFSQTDKLIRNAQFAEFLFIEDREETRTLVMKPSSKEYATFTINPFDIEQIDAIQAELQCNRGTARDEFARRREQCRRPSSAS